MSERTGEGAQVELGHIILPVADLDAALAFCSDALALPLKFRDGARYAALDGGRGTLALAAPEEQAVPGQVVIGLRVDDLDAVEARLVEAGASIVGERVESAHERRLTFLDPDGNAFVAYEPLPRDAA
jgi:predicted enzyme related to lactoylglutathione lyase